VCARASVLIVFVVDDDTVMGKAVIPR